MTKQMKALDEMKGNWYGQMQDIFGELNENDIDFYEATCEYIAAGYHDSETDEDVQVEIKLGGTSRTITIEEINEVYRG